MTTIATSLARLIALPVVSAGIVGGVALGTAAAANAETVQHQAPGYSYSPQDVAPPAPGAIPGWHNHHGIRYRAAVAEQATDPGEQSELNEQVIPNEEAELNQQMGQ